MHVGKHAMEDSCREHWSTKFPGVFHDRNCRAKAGTKSKYGGVVLLGDPQPKKCWFSFWPPFKGLLPKQKTRPRGCKVSNSRFWLFGIDHPGPQCLQGRSRKLVLKIRIVSPLVPSITKYIQIYILCIYMYIFGVMTNHF